MQAIIYSLTVWASKRNKLAIVLIVVFEFFNVAIGLTIGSSLGSYIPVGSLMGVIVLIVFLRTVWQRYGQISLVGLSGRAKFMFKRHLFWGLFALNLLTYTVVGGIMGHMITSPMGTPALWGRSNTIWVYSEQANSPKKPTHWPYTFRKRVEQQAKKSDTGRRIGYVILFLLGLGAAYVSAALACSLACSNYGLLAVLVTLLGLGVLAGGIYFLGRAFNKEIIPYKEMSPAERKREKRRYFRILLGTVIGVVLIIIGAAI